MKTQAELDAAVIAAAEQWQRLYTATGGGGCDPGSYDKASSQYVDARRGLDEAVRARCEATKPHKAALLCYIESTWYDGDSVGFSPSKVINAWEEATEKYKVKCRMLLAELLAAPDEPEGER